jgi:DNA-binding transcriptional LysR family regulator
MICAQDSLHRRTFNGSRPSEVAMTIDQVEAFVAVATHGSLAKAARNLTIAVGPQALWHRITKLEASLQTPLFQRDDGNEFPGLTEAGRRFLPKAYELLNSVTGAQGVVAPGEALRIAAARSLCAYLLPDVLRDVREREPNARFVVLAAQSTHVHGLVHTRQADLGLRYARGPRAEGEGGLTIEILGSEPLVLVHRKSRDVPRTIRLARLSKQPLIVFEKGSTSWAMTHDLFRQARIYPNVACEVASVETAKKLVEHGVGFSFLPQRAVHEELEHGDLVDVALVEPHDLSRRIELICDSTSRNPLMAMVSEVLGAPAHGVGWGMDPISGQPRQVRR